MPRILASHKPPATVPLDAAGEELAARASSRISLPAWGMSAIAHLIILFILALFVRATPRAITGEPSRNVGIVLAQSDTRSDQTFYEDSQQADATSNESSSRSDSDTAAAAVDAIPAQVDASDLTLPDIQLPGAEAPLGNVDDVLVSPVNLGGGGRKPILPGLDDAVIFADEAARRAAAKARGNPTRISLFGSSPAEGRSFVFAIDRSKSMGGSGLNALAAARAELAAALEKLSPNHRFQVLAYHHKPVYYNTSRLIPATPENKRGVPTFIGQLAALGGTVHEMALRTSLAMEPDVIFLLTDGGDPYLNDIQLKNIRKLADGHATIHCIQFGFGESPPSGGFMKRLARENGGGYSYVNMSGAAGQVHEQP